MPVHAVCLTFDVDARAGLGTELEPSAKRLTTLSERDFGIARGLPRILAMLASHGILATFYLPGATAHAHPDAMDAIRSAGHEVGHHGHDHLPSHLLDAARQEEEIDRGLEALAPYLAAAFGYRSPAWELTPATAELLVARGFAYDSSLMGDDRPYWLPVGEGRLLELPVHWSLDDVIWFEVGRASLPTDGEAWRRAWLAEIAAAAVDQRPITLTMHPEVIGRGSRAAELERLLGELTSGGTPFLTHGELASRVSA
jgi:peptidoglycan-N-acetylglucosamine deacetylase